MADLNEHVEAGFSWCEVGSGPTILFLHPIVGTSRFWEAQMLELSDRWRCVALDAPGYGSSEQVAPPIAPAVTRRLIAFLDHLEVARADIVGLSLGGMHAMHLAAHAPARVDRMVLADTSAAFGIEPEPWLAEWLAPLRSGASMETIARESIQSITYVELPPHQLATLASAFGQVSPLGFEHASMSIAEHNVRALLPSLANECLVIVGDQDDETPIEYSEEIALLMPNATLEVLEGVGHLSSLEAPETFMNHVRDFLSR